MSLALIGGGILLLLFVVTACAADPPRPRTCSVGLMLAQDDPMLGVICAW